jgi:hypothetical protein
LKIRRHSDVIHTAFTLIKIQRITDYTDMPVTNDMPV